MRTLMKLRCKGGKICLRAKMKMPSLLLKKKNCHDINERKTVSPTIMVCRNLKPYNVKIWTVSNCSVFRMSFLKDITQCVKSK